MNNLKKVFKSKSSNLLNIFFTAGYPELSSTVDIALALAAADVDMIEIGMPYSDPLADGETIQHSSSVALKNGMNVDVLFDQVKEIRKKSDLPIILMGYLNQLIKYGTIEFLDNCKTCGVDGLIIPDLPMDIYTNQYQKLFEERDILVSFLVTPRTNNQRIQLADQLSSGFIYVVADNSITGSSSGDTSLNQIEYFEKIKNLKLMAPTLIGFGISNHEQFKLACEYANGAIIGSEFIRNTAQNASPQHIKRFVNEILAKSVSQV